MVQLSPDTRADDWDACAGYHYDDTTIDGFSHTHLSGTGCADLADILFHPTTRTEVVCDGEYLPQPYAFSHDRERASCGYYAVELPERGACGRTHGGAPYGRAPLCVPRRRAAEGGHRPDAHDHR